MSSSVVTNATTSGSKDADNKYAFLRFAMMKHRENTDLPSIPAVVRLRVWEYAMEDVEDALWSIDNADKNEDEKAASRKVLQDFSIPLAQDAKEAGAIAETYHNILFKEPVVTDDDNPKNITKRAKIILDVLLGGHAPQPVLSARDKVPIWEKAHERIEQDFRDEPTIHLHFLMYLMNATLARMVEGLELAKEKSAKLKAKLAREKEETSRLKAALEAAMHGNEEAGSGCGVKRRRNNEEAGPAVV